MRAASKLVGLSTTGYYTDKEVRDALYEIMLHRNDAKFSIRACYEKYGIPRTTFFRMRQLLPNGWQDLPPSSTPKSELRTIADNVDIPKQGRKPYLLPAEMASILQYCGGLHSAGDGRSESQIRAWVLETLQSKAPELCGGDANEEHRLGNAKCSRTWMVQNKLKVAKETNLTNKAVKCAKKSTKRAMANQPHFTKCMYERLDAFYK